MSKEWDDYFTLCTFILTSIIKKHKIDHFIRELQQWYIYIYTPNIKAPEYVKQRLTELKGKTESNTIIVGDFKIDPGIFILEREKCGGCVIESTNVGASSSEDEFILL